jgi:hypothetical protein
MVQVLYNCKHPGIYSHVESPADLPIDSAPDLMTAQRIAHNDTLRSEILDEYTANRSGLAYLLCSRT